VQRQHVGNLLGRAAGDQVDDDQVTGLPTWVAAGA
jgi:hypothetical protein